MLELRRHLLNTLRTVPHAISSFVFHHSSWAAPGKSGNKKRRELKKSIFNVCLFCALSSACSNPECASSVCLTYKIHIERHNNNNMTKIFCLHIHGVLCLTRNPVTFLPCCLCPLISLGMPRFLPQGSYMQAVFFQLLHGFAKGKCLTCGIDRKWADIKQSTAKAQVFRTVIK